MKRVVLMVLGSALVAGAQGVDFAVLEKLGEKATKSATIELGAEQLAMLAGVKGSAEAEKLGQLLKELKSVRVRNFEFETPGMYDMELVRAFRDKVKASGEWMNIISVKERDGFTDVSLRKGAEGKADAMLIVAAEPKELTVVHIEGVSDLGALAQLGTLARIPGLHRAPKRAPAEKQ